MSETAGPGHLKAVDADKIIGGGILGGFMAAYPLLTYLVSEQISTEVNAGI